VNPAPLSGLYVCEGSSDVPLADIVEFLYAERGCALRLSRPNFEALRGVRRDVKSKLVAGARLIDEPFNLAVVHRDADRAGWQERRDEIESALTASGVVCDLIPVIPITMTEAWLLLDEQEIREVAGNPNGREVLSLPKTHEAERVADPKALLRECLLQAASARGRRRQTVASRFSQHRAQLLQRLDINGPVTQLTSWKMLIADIDRCVESLRPDDPAA
jgi:hypothetical protein